MLDLKLILPQIWTDLQHGVNNPTDAFHNPVLGTLELNTSGSNLRTVVLRSVEPEHRAIICYTDVRATKVEQIRKHKAVSWLFYDAQRKIQIRAQGSSRLHNGDVIALQHWQKTSLANRRSYLALYAPGTPLSAPGSGLPDNFDERVPDLAQSEAGWPNFSVIVSTIEFFDWLYLDAKGNRRAQFNWTGKNFESNWVIP